LSTKRPRLKTLKCWISSHPCAKTIGAEFTRSLAGLGFEVELADAAESGFAFWASDRRTRTYPVLELLPGSGHSP